MRAISMPRTSRTVMDDTTSPRASFSFTGLRRMSLGFTGLSMLAVSAPLPLAGRGRGWGYFARSSLAILLPSGRDKHLGLPLGFTPPLTPPRQGEGNQGEQAARPAPHS